MAFDNRAFRDVLGRFATGIVVVTARTVDGGDIGMTVNSFTSVSLDPPLVLYCLGFEASQFEAFANAKSFAFNILAETQEALSNRFAMRSLQDRFADVPISVGETGAPLLDGALAAIECFRESTIEAGDHVIIIGRVVAMRAQDGRPLTYYKGAYARLD